MMNFVRVLIMSVFAAATLVGWGQSVFAQASERPNILFLFADDWGRYASIYNEREKGGLNEIVKTPHFDRVAREGVLFNNAFVNAPSCTPCRSSLLSGQHFWRTGRGAILNGAVWDENIPSFPLLLQKSGYHIGYTYKVWSPGNPVDAPFGGNKNAFMRRGRTFGKFSCHVTDSPDIDAGKQAMYDEVRGNFQDFLAARPVDKPFLYWFGPTNTHRAWVKGSGKAFWKFDPDQLKGKLPAGVPDVPEVREDLADYLGEVQAFDAAIGVILDELQKTGQYDNTLIAISGDHGVPGVPRGKCNLYDLGAHVSLAISWKNRIPAGRIVDDFVTLPDLCPTFLEAGGVAPLEIMTGRSLLPVIESSRSEVVDSTRDHVLIGRERHVAEAREGNLPYPQRAIRTADYLYIRNFTPDRWPMGSAPGFGKPDGEMPSADALTNQTFAAFSDVDASPTKAWMIGQRNHQEYAALFELGFGLRPGDELYDLKKDPGQLKNVASDPAYASELASLKRRLMSELQETGDPRVTGDGSTFDKSPYTDWQQPRQRSR